MRWIDIELPAVGANPQLDKGLAAAWQLVAEIPAIQERDGLDGALVTEQMALAGQQLFQAIQTEDPTAFSVDAGRVGAHLPHLGRPEVDGLIGYHLVTDQNRQILPWTWLHNGIAFLLERHPICASAHPSRVPEVEQPRPWMQRFSEALFRDNIDGMRNPMVAGRTSAGGAAAVPEIFFVPGHCHEDIRRLIYREADSIRGALGAASLPPARLRVPEDAITPGQLVAMSLMYQALHFAGPTSQPLSSDENQRSEWLNQLLAVGESLDDQQTEDMVGLEGDLVGIDPVDSLLDTVIERYEETADSPERLRAAAAVSAAGRSASAGVNDAIASEGDASGHGGLGPPEGQLASTWLLEDGPLLPENLGRGGSVPPLVFSNSYLSLPVLGDRFLAAGASTFVGPLIPLYSRPARKFAGRFYSFLGDGLCCAAALRSAALSLREQLGHEHPAWLSYGVTGYGSLALPFL